jgi:hypothetical protein
MFFEAAASIAFGAAVAGSFALAGFGLNSVVGILRQRIGLRNHRRYNIKSRIYFQYAIRLLSNMLKRGFPAREFGNEEVPLHENCFCYA